MFAAAVQSSACGVEPGEERRSSVVGAIGASASPEEINKLIVCGVGGSGCRCEDGASCGVCNVFKGFDSLPKCRIVPDLFGL